MSKLTDHLRALLARFYSKNDAAEVSNLSAPYDKGVSLFIGETTENWQTLASGVASTDGYLAIVGKNKSSVGSPYISVENCSTGVDSLIPLPSTGAMRAFTRIGKGQNFRATAHDAKELDVRFIKTIGAFMGGGNLALVLGGGLCLSHFLERSAKRLLAMLSQLQRQFKLASLVITIGKASPLPMMGTSHLKGVMERLVELRFFLRSSSLAIYLLGQQEYQSQSKKGIRYASSRMGLLSFTPSSTHQKQAFNLSFGGAL